MESFSINRMLEISGGRTPTRFYCK